MRYTKQLLFLFITGVSFVCCSSDNLKNEWVINEVMVQNETNFVDHFGKRSGWIEIYNNTAKTMDLGGLYLTNDPNDPTKYVIPRGDILTSVKPHQHVLFFADEKPFYGTFHTSFKLNPTKENYIALFDNDGKTLLDEIVIPAGMAADKTYGYENDGIKHDEKGNNLATGLKRVTPGSNNAILEEDPEIKALAEEDPWGGILTVTSMLVVFSGLILLFLAFRLSDFVAKNMSKKRVIRSGKLSAARSHSHLSGEVLAAISAAIYEINEDQHDIESTILTIHQVKRNFSPWNTKRQSLRELPQ